MLTCACIKFRRKNLIFTLPQYILIFLSAVAAGIVNALAGGGTLITFPALLALGLPAVSANVTNKIAIMPGFFGAALAQLKDLKGQEKRLAFAIPTSAAAGLLGGWLLIVSGESIFKEQVPFFILAAAVLLGIQDTVRDWLLRRAGTGRMRLMDAWIILPVGIACTYAGYFGAGAGVIILALIGLVLDETMTRLNAIKLVVSLVSSLTASVYFMFTGHINWPAALIMMAGSLAGGLLGGRLADVVNPQVLRRIVVVVGVVLAVVYFVK